MRAILHSNLYSLFFSAGSADGGEGVGKKEAKRKYVKKERQWEIEEEQRWEERGREQESSFHSNLGSACYRNTVLAASLPIESCCSDLIAVSTIQLNLR